MNSNKYLVLSLFPLRKEHEQLTFNFEYNQVFVTVHL